MSTTPVSRVLSNREGGWDTDSIGSLGSLSIQDAQDRCDKCKKLIQEVLHEGYLCYDCGLQAHRACSISTQLIPFGLEKFKQTLFGLGLCAQFDPNERPAPALVMLLTQEIESRAQNLTVSDIFQLYGPCINEVEQTELKHKLTKDVNSVVLSQYDSNSIAAVLKTFLYALPDPVIPVQWYEVFIETVQTGSEIKCVTKLTNIVQELPNHHKLTLQFLLAHLIRLCQLQNASDEKGLPEFLIEIFCHILLRPAWEKFCHLVHNLEAHFKVLELLLFHGDWGEKLPEYMSAPALPPRKVSRPGPPHTLSTDAERETSSNIPSLHDAEWYWGDISREEVNEKLMETSDGTFLVRNASSKAGEFTLTLRKGGTNKLIKICHSNGKYGFSPPYTFTSVVDLVNFYKHTSLAQYNEILDIKLLHPVSKYQQEDESTNSLDNDKVAKKLVELEAYYQDRSRVFADLKEVYEKTGKEIHRGKSTTLDAYKELLKLFLEQQDQQEKFRKEAQPHEIKRLIANCELLRNQTKLVEESREVMKEELKRRLAYYKTLEREMISLKQDLSSLIKQKEQYMRCLRSRGIKQSQIDHFLAPEGSYELETEKDLESLPHQNESLWFLMSCSRQDATNLLEGKANGTFLVRPSSSGQYALSIVCNNVVNHCIIYKTERGYGFAEPYNIYATIKLLVLHYARNSLEEHNEELATKLAYPVYGPTPPAYRGPEMILSKGFMYE